MAPEERKDSRLVSATKAIRPCAQGQLHPLQTRRLERLCAVCQHARDKRLEVIDSLNSQIHIEPWQWQFKYQGKGTPMQRVESSKEVTAITADATAWDMTKTLSGLVSGSPSWMKDWKRQEPTVAD